MAGLLTAVGLAAPAGLNAYLVLLIVGLAARVAGTIVLPPALAWLGNPWVLVALGAALTAEIFITKMPRLAPASERIGLAVRPIAGALVAMAGAAATDLAPVAAAAIGAVCAGAVHLLKAAVRARVVYQGPAGAIKPPRRSSRGFARPSASIRAAAANDPKHDSPEMAALRAKMFMTLRRGPH